MSDFTTPLGSTHAATPKYRLLQQRPLTGAGGSAGYQGDQLALGSPLGGNGTDPALLAQTEQLMNSPNVSDRYRAIVNLTKMSPADALPRLQAMAAVPGQDPQVIQLANEAMRVMSQMAQAQPQQPAYGQPPQQQPAYGQPQVQPGYQPQPTVVQPGYQQQAMPAPTYNPGVGAPVNPADAAFVMQTAQTDLAYGGDRGIQAVRQIAAVAQGNPQLKEQAYNLLLNHVYHKRDASVTEALKALGAMGNPQLLPYLQMVQRDSGYPWEAQAVAVSLMKQMASQPAQPGAASANTSASPEYIRAMEFELKRGGNEGMAAFQQIRNALGPDPRAAGPVRQEVIRVLVTHAVTSYDPATVTAACQLLGQMGAREMDALRYLDAVVRNNGQSPQAQQAARAAIQQILATPATR